MESEPVMYTDYAKGFSEGQIDWQYKQLDDNPYLHLESDLYKGWRDGWIAENKKWNPNWYINRKKENK